MLHFRKTYELSPMSVRWFMWKLFTVHLIWNLVRNSSLFYKTSKTIQFVRILSSIKLLQVTMVRFLQAGEWTVDERIYEKSDGELFKVQHETLQSFRKILKVSLENSNKSLQKFWRSPNESFVNSKTSVDISNVNLAWISQKFHNFFN